MADLTGWYAFQMVSKGVKNRLEKRPLALSLETTLSCNCRCQHCGLGGIIKDEKQISAHDYAMLIKTFQPVVVQISGGEPLLRKDITDIARAIKQASYPIYLIFVTNGVLLNEEIYLKLQQAGVNQFSISLDFPDSRHDDFRHRSHLYQHLENIIPRLSALGAKDIILNAVITRINLKDIIPLAYKAKDWRVAISYSIYTPRRTGSREYCIDTSEDLQLLHTTIHQLMELDKRVFGVANLRGVFLDTLKFVYHGYYMGNCSAGKEFLVINPAGKLIPCSLFREKEYTNQKDMIKNFSAGNNCGDCYVSIRSYSEQSPLKWIMDAPAYVKQFLGNHNNRADERTDASMLVRNK